MSTAAAPGTRERIEQWCGSIVDARWFTPFIVGVIALIAFLLRVLRKNT